jgi:hypothetical protein
MPHLGYRLTCIHTHCCLSGIQWDASGRCGGYRSPKLSTEISGVSLTTINKEAADHACAATTRI